jgi:hypothetical protein
MDARLRLFRLALMTALFGCAGPAHAQVEEDTLKAAFIYNFALYTTWPAPLRDAKTLTICVQRTSPLAPALHALSGKAVQQRTLVVNEIDPDGSHAGCDVQVAESANAGIAHEPGVLTVCDCSEDRDASGAVVLLVREGTRLRFDIDLAAASASGLSLSSKLLHLARTIR